MADRPVAPHAPQQSHALGSINRTPRTLGRGGENRRGERNGKKQRRGEENEKNRKREKGERNKSEPKERRRDRGKKTKGNREEGKRKNPSLRRLRQQCRCLKLPPVSSDTVIRLRLQQHQRQHRLQQHQQRQRHHLLRAR
jgi:hypothetical protein